MENGKKKNRRKKKWNGLSLKLGNTLIPFVNLYTNNGHGEIENGQTVRYQNIRTVVSVHSDLDRYVMAPGLREVTENDIWIDLYKGWDPYLMITMASRPKLDIDIIIRVGKGEILLTDMMASMNLISDNAIVNTNISDIEFNYVKNSHIMVNWRVNSRQFKEEVLKEKYIYISGNKLTEGQTEGKRKDRENSMRKMERLIIDNLTLDIKELELFKTEKRRDTGIADIYISKVHRHERLAYCSIDITNFDKVKEITLMLDDGSSYNLKEKMEELKFNALMLEKSGTCEIDLEAEGIEGASISVFIIELMGKLHALHTVNIKLKLSDSQMAYVDMHGKIKLGALIRHNEMDLVWGV